MFSLLPREAVSFEISLAEIQTAISEDLTPFVQEIDLRGVYPRAFMQRIGSLGAFSQAVPKENCGAGHGLKQAIQVMEAVSSECLSTGFCVWCQMVCAWYIQHSGNEHLKTHLLPPIAQGSILAGTGLSNPMKHFAGIEKIHLTAERCSGGFIINGALPWVSNVASDHYFGIVAQINEEQTYLAALVPGDLPGLKLGDGGHFIALEGSSTHNAVFQSAMLPDSFVLSAPCSNYIQSVRPGFVLAQCGFGLGLIESCREMMQRSNHRVGHVNCYLEDGADEIGEALAELKASVYLLADEIGCGGHSLDIQATKEAVSCRIRTSELALRAAQAAMLHAGAAGYRAHSAAERKLRESYFVAIVTPALKHLKKLQRDNFAAYPGAIQSALAA